MVLWELSQTLNPPTISWQSFGAGYLGRRLGSTIPSKFGPLQPRGKYILVKEHGACTYPNVNHGVIINQGWLGLYLFVH